MQTSNPPVHPFDKLNALLPLLWLSLAFLAGILLADQVQASTWTWIWLGLASFFLALLIRLVFARRAADPARLTNTFLAALALAAFFFGGARMRSTIPRIDPTHIAYYNDLDREVIVTGTVAFWPADKSQPVVAVLDNQVVQQIAHAVIAVQRYRRQPFHELRQAHHWKRVISLVKGLDLSQPNHTPKGG